jgi:hypothetical protein
MYIHRMVASGHLLSLRATALGYNATLALDMFGALFLCFTLVAIRAYDLYVKFRHGSSLKAMLRLQISHSMVCDGSSTVGQCPAT